MDPIQQDMMAPGVFEGEMLPETIIESPINEPLPMPQIEGSSTRIIRDSNIRRTNYTEPATRQPRKSPPAKTRSPERTRQAAVPERDQATSPRTVRKAPANATQAVARPAPAKPDRQPQPAQPVARGIPTAGTMNWDRLGLTPPQQSMGPNRATIKPVK